MPYCQLIWFQVGWISCEILIGSPPLKSIEAGAVRDDNPVFADADAADGRRAQTPRDFGDGPERRLVCAVILRDVERMLFHKIEAFAQFEGGADGLAVVFGDDS